MRELIVPIVALSCNHGYGRIMLNVFERTLKILFVAFLSIVAFGAIILGWNNPKLSETGAMLFVLSYCCAVLPLSLISAGWLILASRSYLANTFIWMAFQLLFGISMALYSMPGFGLFFSTLLFILFPLIGLVDFLYVYQKGAALRFMAWGSIVFIWSILAAWKIAGNFLGVWIENVSGSSNSLWWMYFSMYGTAWMVVAGIIAFFFETIFALKIEFSQWESHRINN